MSHLQLHDVVKFSAEGHSRISFTTVKTLNHSSSASSRDRARPCILPARRRITWSKARAGSLKMGRAMQCEPGRWSSSARTCHAVSRRAPGWSCWLRVEDSHSRLPSQGGSGAFRRSAFLFAKMPLLAKVEK
jgi:hypothetical protein